MEKIEKLTKIVMNELEEMVKNGGEGSGDFDHAGRPGLVGGSEPTESREKRGFKSKSERKEVKKEESKKENTEIKEVSREEAKKEIERLREEIQKFRSKGDLTEYRNMRSKYYALVEAYTGKKTPEEYKKAQGIEIKNSDRVKIKEDKKEENKDKLDIKKTTVTTKAGKKREIEYVESVPDGFKELKGATTAPLGYTWYTNGKSILDKSRKSILVKDKANNSIYKHEYIEY